MTPQEILAKPSREEVEKLWRNRALCQYRVDIESDSTTRGDVQKNQEQMSLFLQGSAQFLTAVGPMVQQGVMPPDVAVEVYAAFSRSFRLGKQAEDALDRLADQTRKAAGQPKPPSEAQQKLQLEREKMQHEVQMSQVDLGVKQEELKLKATEAQMKMALEEKKTQHEMQLKELELQHEMQLAQMKAQQEAEIATQEAAIKAQTMQQEAQVKIQTHAQMAQQKQAMDAASFEEKRQREGLMFEEQRHREGLAFNQKQRFAEQSFKNDQARADVASDAETKTKAQIAKDRDAADAKERKGRKRKVTITRGKDGRMSGAEIED